LYFIYEDEMKTVKVEFKKIEEFEGTVVLDGKTIELPKLPDKQRETDAGYDCYSAEEGTVLPGQSHNFHTGVRIACPKGFFYSIRGRSGLGFKNIQPFIGTIDSAFNGALRILLLNHGTKPYHVHKGERIAQIIFEEQIKMDPIEVKKFSKDYDIRGIAGFGSSGL